MTNEIKTINDLMPNSHDWNAERLAQLKAIMPDLFNLEGQLNIDELKKLINPALVNETERYEFRWFGKSNAKRNAFSPSNATLNFDAARSINPQNAQNLIIEGDNLEVLKLLSTAYREQVKMIYIDPPYNTGNDFVYSDNFTQDKTAYWQDAEVLENGVKVDTNSESDGRYHSNWLNMMFSRLLIARQLLRDDGVIFISIDDNEAANLKKLCDEVFGEESFLGQFTINSTPNARDYGHIGKMHEFCIFYGKNIKKTITYEIEEKEKFFKYHDEIGGFNIHPLYNSNEAFTNLNRPNLYYPFYCNRLASENGFFEISLSKKDGWIEIYPPCSEKNNVQFVWRWGKEKSKLEVNLEIIGYKTESDEFRIVQKMRHTTKIVRSILFDSMLSTRRGTAEIEALLGAKFFDFPKSKELIKTFLMVGADTKSNDLVLDFFAGSGTTAQAVMELNLEDGGNRQYICVQLPEATDEKSEAYKAGYKKISDITIARAAKVIDKLKAQYQADKPEQMNALGFKVFKLTKSHFPRVAFAPDVAKTDAENIVLLQQYIKEKEAQLTTLFNADALMTEILLKNGFTLNYTLVPQAQLTQNKLTLAEDGNKTALVCLDDALHSDTVAYFMGNIAHKFICLERALDTTKKYNLKHSMGDQFIAF